MEIRYYHLCILLAVSFSVSAQNVKFPNEDNAGFSETVLKSGEETYKLTTTYSQMPVYGPCWKKPLSNLPTACGNLTEEAHKWLALTFANCFLLQSHQKPHACVEPTPSNISRCLDMGMDDRVFNAYNSFYIHTHNMCYFLKNQIWQEETRKTVFQLMDASHRVVMNMESQLEIQKKIRHTQELALQNGVDLRKEMDITISKSKETLQELMDEIKQSSGQQMAVFDEIAHHIVKLRALFFGELVGVYTVLYYFFVVIISYLLTSCKRLESARLGLYILYTLSLAAEYSLANYGTESTMKMFSDQVQAEVYARVWFIRKLTLAVGVLVLVISAWRYRDFIDVVWELQKDNQQTRKDILSLIQCMRQESSTIKYSSMESRYERREMSPVRTSQSLHSYVKEMTPVREMSPAREMTSVREMAPARELLSTTRQVEMRRASSPYNLRERSPLVVKSPLAESPAQFAKQVAKSAKKSKQTSQLVREHLKQVKEHRLGTILSSDED